MANPIVEQIMIKVAAKLATVTTANGYQVDVSSVYRPATKLGINRTPPGSYVVQLMLSDASRNDELSISSNPPRVAWDQAITVDCIYSPSDSATDPLDQVLTTFASDVTKAMFADDAGGDNLATKGTWAGLAVTTEIIDIEAFEGETDGTCYLRLTFIITYRVRENDPYNQ